MNKRKAQTTIAAFLLIVIVLAWSQLIVTKCIYFFDYQSYVKAIGNWYAPLLWANEPVSVFIMFLSAITAEWFSGTAVETDPAFQYYMLVWLFYLAIVLYIASKYYRDKMWFTATIFMISNPMVLLLYEVPRSFVAYSLILLAVHNSGFKKALLIIGAILSQNLTGLFAAYIIYLEKFNRFFLVLAGLSVITIIYFDPIGNLGVYSEVPKEQGRGFVLYAMLFSMMFAILSHYNKYSNANYKIFLFRNLIVLFIYFLNPIAYRFFTIMVVWEFLFLVSNLRSRNSLMALRLFTFLNVVVSLYIVLTGRFGYSDEWQ